tara:strand:- start:2222 stop:3124 length:903 start_codon:yes stop_codon:yes gene_type:complete
MFTILSFYKLKKINKLKNTKNLLIKKIKYLSVKGLIILSPEGINGTLAGTEKNINILKKIILSNLKLIKFDIENITKSNFVPFLKAKIKIKSEVVPINEKYNFSNKTKKKYLSPLQWNKFLTKKNTMIIDARKPFEYEVGTFKGSINPDTNNFREFKKYLSNIKKKDHVGMFCTGGIRCEKASNYLYKNGFKNIYMLKGGIINYFNKVDLKKNKWKGECFVFDNRVSLKKDATQGSYGICNACRMPISKKEMRSSKYKIGLSCPKCYDNLSKEQIKRFTMRHKQIINSKIKYNFRKQNLK